MTELTTEERMKACLKEAYKNFASYYGKVNFGLNEESSTISAFTRYLKMSREDFDEWIAKK